MALGTGKAIGAVRPQPVVSAPAASTGGSGEYFTRMDSTATGTKSSTGSGTAAGTSLSAMDLYNQYLDSQRALEAALAAQKQQLAQDAYNQNMAALAAAYSQRTSLLQNNLNTTLQGLQQGYDYSKGALNDATERDLQSAYVNMMLSQRDTPQLLTAQGISGGLSESTLAGIRGNYGAERNNLSVARTGALAQLLNTLQNNQSGAYQTYNSQLASDALGRAEAEVKLKTALANGIAQILSDQYTSVAKLDQSYLAKMAALVK